MLARLLASTSRQLRQQSTVLPAARQFATSAPARDENQDKSLSQVLQDVSDGLERNKQAEAQWAAERPRFKFQANTFVRPHYFSRKHRYGYGLWAAPTKRALVAPGGREAARHDILHQLEIDPLHEHANVHLLSKYVSDMGKIKSRIDSGLTTKNHRRLSKAIKRAKMMGLMPTLSNPKLHPNWSFRR
ncbi:hypothetical protein CONPUDRAFT_123135 [Coniophora puteana RWD-64-598 SS2]|uniref:Small ribosomal subunit protein bS18m n=1 Tax=Coniophora puteana (strain RWD-64-598) TaxID=741705 RepID=A0A5M3MT34_CONPW|nr:uncharacterized protein CONPUDRAFT_123135 [Coniophora puteana RWD-64-598 SS2]EIW82329.1 hypothetical protein CONPUDRAFT_123135 [Coniophora puteana RWD-64-598 SS2]